MLTTPVTRRLCLLASLCLMIFLTGRAWTLIRPASSAVRARRLADILPKDLDNLQSTNVMGALGIQLLAFGGWAQQGAQDWTRRESPTLRRRSPLTLKDRLAFITPAWKEGGTLDYARIFSDGKEFLDAHHENGKVKTMAELADVLENRVGLGVADFDNNAIAAMNAMLSWRISEKKNSTVLRDRMVLLVLSFGNEETCHNTLDCPRGPGATNELSAATAARFIQQRESSSVKILAQWEVATALRQHYNDTLRDSVLKSIGTPGSYATTADVLEEMVCNAWSRDYDPSDEPDVVLLAHPDHLRRVLWTVQTLLKRRRSYLRSACSLLPKNIQLMTALQPYSLRWPGERNKTSSINLYDSLEPTEVRTGRELILTDWYDTSRLGFFDNDGDQEWTYDRETWILYDHWAVLKGIVTETIDLDSISSAS